VVLIASALTALTLALIEGSTWGWGSAATIDGPPDRLFDEHQRLILYDEYRTKL
jgi:hypothetical protein